MTYFLTFGCYGDWPHGDESGSVAPEKVLNELKAYASRMLNWRGLDTDGRRRWARHGSIRYLWKREDVEAAVVYVADRQGDPMALYVNEDRW